LFERLQKRNSARRRTSTPEGKARILSIQNRWRDQNRVHVRELDRARKKRSYETDPVVCRCKECGAMWSVVYAKRSQKRSEFCDRKCRNRWHSVQKSRAANRGIRKMDVREQVFEFLREQGPSDAKSIAESIGGKVNSIRSLLCRWAKDGDVLSDGGKPAIYSIISG
jgi:hypothetical protein